MRDRAKRQKTVATYLQIQCKKILGFLKIQVVFKGSHLHWSVGHKSSLILPNHISYLDVIVLNSLFPAMFVTSRDIEITPFLGSLCRYAGCLFVNRKAKKDLLRDINEIARHLNQIAGARIVLFPEGTTSPGLKVLPFKKSLLQAALQSRAQVIPICIKYTKVDGMPFDSSCHDRLAWYGMMQFFPHLWQLMSLRSAEIEVRSEGPLAFRDQKCRKKLTAAIQAQTEKLFFS